MKLNDIVDNRRLIKDDAKRNKGKTIKAIVQSAKRKSNDDSAKISFVSDGQNG